MPKVLVTGAAGRVGRLAVAKLAAQGWNVRALVRRTMVEEAGESAVGDVLDRDSLVRATGGVDAVLHLAATTHARRTADYLSVNVTGTRNLVSAAEAAGVRRFVFASTRTASAGGGGYAASKLEAERVVSQCALEHVIVRLPEMVGAGSTEGVDDVVERVRQGRLIPLVGKGDQTIYPVAAEDVVSALVAAVNSQKAAGKRCVLGGQPMTLHEFAEACKAHFGSNSHIVGVPVAMVRLASLAARFAPLPLYPDQFARLTAPKDPPTPEASLDLGFHPRPLRDALAS